MTVSGLSLTCAVRRCRWRGDNHPGFPPFGAEAKNGFVAGENCFVATGGRNKSLKHPGYFRPKGALKPGRFEAKVLSEVDTGSRQENASDQKSGAFSVPMESKRKRLQGCFLTFWGENTSAAVEPKHRAGRLNQVIYSGGDATFSGSCALSHQFKRGEFRVDTIEAGNEAVRLSGERAIEGPAATKRLTATRPAVCGAMAQQGGEFGRGNQSAPQKLLQLVGCREPKARTTPWIRPLPVPAKR